MNFYFLPEEILNQIIGFLDRKYLRECRQVCRIFYYIATHHYLKEVCLSGNHRLFLQLVCEDYFFGKPLGELVKKISIDEPKCDYSALDEKEFKKLIIHLPNLESIQFEENNYSFCDVFKYTKYLNSMASIFLPSLKHITLPMDSYLYGQVYDTYTSICYHLRSQLITASFYSLPLSAINSHTTVSSFLSEFKSLQNLKLHLSDSVEELINLPDVLYSCPNLKKLSLNLCKSWVSNKTAFNNLSYVALETLELISPNITFVQLCYIQQRLPNLKKLILTQTSSSWEETYWNLNDTYKKEIIDYWNSLNYISLNGVVSLDKGREFLLYRVFRHHLKLLFEEGYNFAFSGVTHLIDDSEGITIDKKTRKVVLHTGYRDIDVGMAEESNWINLSEIIPLSTIDIKSELYNGQIEIKVEQLQKLVKNASKLSRISIVSKYERLYLGPIISTDWLFEELIDSVPLKVIKKKEPMEMLLLSFIGLSTELLQTIGSISDKVQSAIIWYCNVDDDIIDLRMFKNLNRLELDLSGFRSYTAHNFLVKFISNEKEKVFSCCPFFQKESIKLYDSKEEISLVLYVLCNQLTQLTLKYSGKLFFSF